MEDLRNFLLTLKMEENSAGDSADFCGGYVDDQFHSAGAQFLKTKELKAPGVSGSEIHLPTGDVGYSTDVRLKDPSEKEEIYVLGEGDMDDKSQVAGNGEYSTDFKVQEDWKEKPANHSECYTVSSDVNTSLPEALMEKIISKISFPGLFKAKILSKSWFFKLPSLTIVHSMSSYEQREDSKSRSWFHHEIGQASQNWPTYCPVFVWKKRIFGFDQNSSQWKEFPIHHEIPMPQRSHEQIQSANVYFAGSLMIYYRPDEEESTSAFVANPLTGDWTILPGFPNVFQCLCIFKKQCCRGQYNIVIVNAEWYTAGSLRVTTRTLDTRARTWLCEESFLGTMVDDAPQLQVEGGTPATYFGPSSAYLNGRVYIVLWGERVEIWEFGIECRTWKIVHLNLAFETSTAGRNQFRNFGVYVVGCELYLVVLTGFMSDEPVIYQLDLKTLQPVPLRRWKKQACLIPSSVASLCMLTFVSKESKANSTY
ncbi:hypothetical protein AXG93_2953s1140 [Marchantia polymorpha subsp. ruderalis]|uniref:F-box domain-containing protein n=1 Tax=Marchantia polymorpha subsp. ruderalis TaxID=1480154 RepID=A0A176WMY9_MARPO|nr:hypothetical protein AXG93_2953s1140 [Marchantia polymorpha subsp. ruderalis]